MIPSPFKSPTRQNTKEPKDQQLRVPGFISQVFRSVSQLLLEREHLRTDLATATFNLRGEGETLMDKAENHRGNKKSVGVRP